MLGSYCNIINGHVKDIHAPQKSKSSKDIYSNSLGAIYICLDLHVLKIYNVYNLDTDWIQFPKRQIENVSSSILIYLIIWCVKRVIFLFQENKFRRFTFIENQQHWIHWRTFLVIEILLFKEKLSNGFKMQQKLKKVWRTISNMNCVLWIGNVKSAMMLSK